jgi:ferredoxin
MIVASLKPIVEIMEMICGYPRVLIVGCGGCTAVCLTGGQREVDDLRRKLAKEFKKEQTRVVLHGFTVERQCEMDFIEALDPMKDTCEAILSLGCGAGVQLIAERYPDLPVFPALDTVFVGVKREVGWYEEKCRSCGDCQLGYTGGTCPVTRCGKSLFNGPCGGTQGKGGCELDENVPCAWFEIVERLERQGRLSCLEKVRSPMKWKNQIQGTLVLDAYKDRYGK